MQTETNNSFTPTLPHLRQFYKKKKSALLVGICWHSNGTVHEVTFVTTDLRYEVGSSEARRVRGRIWRGEHALIWGSNVLRPARHIIDLFRDEFCQAFDCIGADNRNNTCTWNTKKNHKKLTLAERNTKLKSSWFSRHLRHSARKRSGPILSLNLTTLDLGRGKGWACRINFS